MTEARPTPETEGGSGFADVSVIIPAYRAAATVARALRSVAAQTLKPREAIVVDDGSDDGTFEAARACADDMRGVALRVLRQDRGGAGAARNAAVAAATSRYVAFLDADDEWLPEKIARSLTHFTDDGIVLVSHNVLVNDGSRDVLVDCARLVPADKSFSSLYRRGYISTSTVMARRDAVLAVGGFDPSLPNAQDFDLWLSLLGRPGNTFVVFGEALTRNHVSADGIMSNTERRLACCLEVARRHAHRLEARPGQYLTSLWFRIVAVHYEAVAVYLARRDPARLLWTCLRLPANLCRVTVASLLDREAAGR